MALILVLVIGLLQNSYAAKIIFTKEYYNLDEVPKKSESILNDGDNLYCYVIDKAITHGSNVVNYEIKLDGVLDESFYFPKDSLLFGSGVAMIKLIGHKKIYDENYVKFLEYIQLRVDNNIDKEVMFFIDLNLGNQIRASKTIEISQNSKGKYLSLLKNSKDFFANYKADNTQLPEKGTLRLPGTISSKIKNDFMEILKKENHLEVKVKEPYVIDNNWSIERLNSEVIKYRDATILMLTELDGKCYYYKYKLRQDYINGKFQEENSTLYKTEFKTLKMQIACDKI